MSTETATRPDGCDLGSRTVTRLRLRSRPACLPGRAKLERTVDKNRWLFQLLPKSFPLINAART